jgi:4-hydroxythreonine-4-phosphate dehydrogenase
MTGLIGISLGDVTGIGPEVTLKALAAELQADDTRYLILGDEDRLRELNARLGLNLRLESFREPGLGGRERHFQNPVAADVSPLHSPGNQSGLTSAATVLTEAPVLVANPLSQSLPQGMAPGAAPAAHAALAWLEDGAKRCLRGELEAFVTAPVNKEAIIRAGHAFIGQTEFLSQLAGTERTVMMLLGHDDRGRWLRVALVSTHVSIKQLPPRITQPKVELAVEFAAQACRDLGLPRARVAVCGLNPHAGEGGQMGDEELTTIGPAVRAAQARGLDVVGPLSADVVFHHALHGEYDVVVAMYHDQGLAPLKTVAFDTGINWTLGLPFIRTSPDHGTAYDIAGKGIANPSSMIVAIRLAKQLARARG